MSLTPAASGQEPSKAQLTVLFLLARPQVDEETLRRGFQEIASILINFILPLKAKSKKEGDYGLDCHGVHRLDRAAIADLAALRSYDLVTAQTAKEVVNTLWAEWSGRDLLQILIQDGWLAEAKDSLGEVVNMVVAEQAQAVSDYKTGKQAAFGRLMGTCMKKLGKGADPKAVKDELIRQLEA